MIDMNYNIIGLRHKPNNNIVFPMITSDLLETIKSEFIKKFVNCDLPKEILDNHRDYDIVLIGFFRSSKGNVIQDGFFNNKIKSIIDFETLSFNKVLYNKKFLSNILKVGDKDGHKN